MERPTAVAHGCYGAVFRWLGPEAATAQLVALGFGFLFLWSLSWLIAKNAGLAVLLPKVVLLCVSAMLEMPGGLAASAVLFSGRRSVVRCAVAGLVLELVLQIKLTAGMVLPAMLAALAWEGMDGSWRWIGMRFLGLFAGMAGAFCVVCGCFFQRCVGGENQNADWRPMGI